MSISLRVKLFSGNELVSEHEFNREIVKIGRLASAHIRVTDPKVARIHACIEPDSGGNYSLIDMGSTEGSIVNGQRVSKHPLQSGDEILLGDSLLIVELVHQSVLPGAELSLESQEPLRIDAFYGEGQKGLIDPASSPPQGNPSLAADVTSATLSNSSAPISSESNAHDFRTGEVTLNPDSFSAPPLGMDSHPQANHDAIMGLAQGHSMSGSWSLPPGSQYGAWGSAPNNLASESVPPKERVLEIKLIWHGSVLETLNFTDQNIVTMGDKARTAGWGPFTRYVGCDIDVPAKTLPDRAFPIAVRSGSAGTDYLVNIHSSFTGHLERADGSVLSIEDMKARGGPAKLPEVWSVPLLAEDTIYLQHGGLTVQLRYIRKTLFVAPGFFETANYAFLNIFVLAFFLHALMIASFLATPKVTVELEEQLYKNPSRFIHTAFIEEKQKQEKRSLLKDLNSGPKSARAKGVEGKAGSRKSKNKEGRMAAKGKPDDKEVARSVLDNILGFGKGGGARGKIFGSGGLGGDLRAAMGNIRGRNVGDAAGNGGLGARGKGPGGGGLSMTSVGLGAIGTAGFGGGGDGGYGDGATALGEKVEREVVISQGTPVIRGSLDKELIRRVIKRHISQIRYCYERQLQVSPGLNGKVRIEWVITAQGRVRSTKVMESTMGNVQVERCMMRKIRTWLFPKPKGGGIVIVTYPWVLKPTG